MIPMLHIYWTFFKTSLALQMQYRVAMFIWLLGMIIEPMMYLVVWRAVAEGRGGMVGTYGGSEFAAYYIAMMVINHLTFSWIMWEYDYYIREGVLAGLLLRPLHPIHKDVAENLAYKVMTSTVTFPTALLLAWGFGARWGADFLSLLAFPLVLAMSILLRLVVEWGLAMAAFWTTRVTAINSAYFSVLFFLSGRVAPLELLPGNLETLAYLSPFPWMIHFPVELLVKGLSGPEILRGLVMQITWCALALFMLGRVWKAGLRRFVAVGS